MLKVLAKYFCRLLQEFVEKKGSKLEVVYTLSGWLKNNPSVYHIRLASRNKLEGQNTKLFTVNEFSASSYFWCLFSFAPKSLFFPLEYILQKF